MSLVDTRMISKAVQQRWPIRPEMRQSIVERLQKIVDDPGSSPREVTAASKALMAAEAQNIADEQHSGVDAGRNRIIELLTKLHPGGSARTIDASGSRIVDASDGAKERAGESTGVDEEEAGG